MREQFLLEEITWLPPINDKPETFSEYGMTSEYQKMYLIQDRLLGDMIRVVCPELADCRLQNPLKPMSTLDISGGGNPNIEQAELFMGMVWAYNMIYHDMGCIETV